MTGLIISLLIIILIVLIMIWAKISAPESIAPNKTKVKFYEIKTKKLDTNIDSPPKPTAKPTGIPINLNNLKRTKSPKKSQIQSNLEAYLVSLVNGDKNIAVRLISNLEIKNPTKDRAWCVQKAIDEILRDRG